MSNTLITQSLRRLDDELAALWELTYFQEEEIACGDTDGNDAGELEGTLAGDRAMLEELC